jgi:hypothetical protein
LGNYSFDEFVEGDVGEWDLSSGDLVKHKVYEDPLICMAISGDKIATSGDNVIQVCNISTCLFLLP